MLSLGKSTTCLFIRLQTMQSVVTAGNGLESQVPRERSRRGPAQPHARGAHHLHPAPLPPQHPLPPWPLPVVKILAIGAYI